MPVKHSEMHKNFKETNWERGAYFGHAGEIDTDIGRLEWSTKVRDMAPTLGIGWTEQLGVKPIDEQWTETNADAKQAEKSSHANYAQSHQIVHHTSLSFAPLRNNHSKCLQQCNIMYNSQMKYTVMLTTLSCN